MPKVVVDSRENAARIRGVSKRTIDRMCDDPKSNLIKVKLSKGRVGIVGARDLPKEDLTIADLKRERRAHGPAPNCVQSTCQSEEE
jgi:hypothetical protein